jgi:glyoxylase-like metal-dependent hydrolase (beta-lactamase superfamily II)
MDWSDNSLTDDAQKADGSSADPFALEHLFRLGLLDLEKMTVPLPREVTLIDTPGETPGHRVVRIASGGEVLYFLADLFHVMPEIDDPSLCPIWADAPALRASRSRIITAIRRERARFLCSHLPDVFSASAFPKPPR